MSTPPLSWYRTPPPPLPVPRHNRRAVRRRRTLDALACLALSSLCFSRAGSDTLFRTDAQFYSRLSLGSPTLVALIVNIVAVAAAGFLAVQLMRRVRRPWSRRLAAVVAAAMFLAALNFARLTYETLGRWASAIGAPTLVIIAVVIVVACLGWPRLTLRALRGLALVLSPLAVVTLALALGMFLEIATRRVPRRVEPAPRATTAPSLRRVVWLLFEDLDPRLAFEARPAGVALPELDRLRRESLYAGAARAPADTTDVAMPALITGRPVVSVVPVSANDLELTVPDGEPVSWSAQPNVFSRARTLGYDTALIGWHLPYPRVLGDSLGVADFRPSVAYDQARGDTIGAALGRQWGTLVPPVHARRLFAERFADIGAVALGTAADGRFGLVLLHLPLPQLPGIYDPARGRLTPWNFSGAAAEYLDNLELADRLLGDLRRGLDRARLDDRTWIVVSSVGGRQRRVPFLVRPPSGGPAAYVDHPFDTLATHDLVLAILRGSVADTADAARWLARAPRAR